uniref:Uncharacterized protein n=1 Tax=Siphoviridae sp. ctiOl67 TaxID=2825622 RepID=A0A8S5QIW5_9CAUD|nr:MAG TPA: hypothetical protein [Siphoviridae sp. ctiOl67]
MSTQLFLINLYSYIFRSICCYFVTFRNINLFP